MDTFNITISMNANLDIYILTKQQHRLFLVSYVITAVCCTSLLFVHNTLCQYT